MFSLYLSSMSPQLHQCTVNVCMSYFYYHYCRYY